MQPDPFYKYPGGFVGKTGDAYHVRFDLDCVCRIREENRDPYEVFLGADCRSEYTIARRNLFQIPNSEFRMAFSRDTRIHIARHPDLPMDSGENAPLGESFQDWHVKLNTFPRHKTIVEGRACVEAALDHAILNATSRWSHPGKPVEIEIEYPVHLINLDDALGEFQVCTGPVIVPDMQTWNGDGIGRVFLAHASFSSFDWVEFVLRQEVEASERDKESRSKVSGRDRWELRDSGRLPPEGVAGKRPLLSGLTAFHKTMGIRCENEILTAIL